MTKKELRAAARKEWDDIAEGIARDACACRRDTHAEACVKFAIEVRAETIVALERGDLEAAIDRARQRTTPDAKTPV